MAAGGRRVRRVGAPILGVLVGMWLTCGVSRAAQPLGGLTQLAGNAGCFTYNGNSEDGAGTCSQARGLAKGESAIVSPDGASVYVGSYPNSGASLPPSFTVFSRNSTTGALTQLPGTAGCLTPNGNSSAGAGTCTKARGLITFAGDGRDFAFTSDGRWAYAVAQNGPPHGAVLIFQRDPTTGALTQLAGSAGCVTSDGSSQDGAATCQTDATLNGPNGISVSSDGRFVYVVDYFTPQRLHTFARNTSTGALSEVQCISEAPAPPGCTTGRVLGNSQFLAVSPDGMHAYGGDFAHGLSIFDRDTSTGLLTQKAGTAGCITDDGKDDTGASTCAVGRVVNGTYPILVAPNGATLYDPANGDHGFSVFHINADGTLAQLSGTSGCVTIDGKDNTGASTCAVGRALIQLYGGALSPDGSTLYVSQRAVGVGGVAIFSIDSTTGTATQLPGLAGCITTDGSSNGTAGQCTDGTALDRGYGMSVSPDGSSVYQATDASSNAGLAAYARETGPVCQSTGVATPFRTPVTVSLRCSDTDGDRPPARRLPPGPRKPVGDRRRRRHRDLHPAPGSVEATASRSPPPTGSTRAGRRPPRSRSVPPPRSVPRARSPACASRPRSSRSQDGGSRDAASNRRRRTTATALPTADHAACQLHAERRGQRHLHAQAPSPRAQGQGTLRQTDEDEPRGTASARG